ncbi:hypothetical protein D3C84_955390 [compost metagenome]
MLRIHSDANAAGHEQLVAINIERLANPCQQPLRQLLGFVPVDTFRKQQKLVATNSKYHTPVIGHGGQPAAGVKDEQIAYVMA